MLLRGNKPMPTLPLYHAARGVTAGAKKREEGGKEVLRVGARDLEWSGGGNGGRKRRQEN